MAFKRTWKNRDGSEASAWVGHYTDADGQRRAVQRERKRDLEAEIDRLKVEATAIKSARAIAAALPPAARTTVETACEDWIRACEVGREGKDAVEWSTLKQYREHVRLHIVPLPMDRDGEDQFGRRTFGKLLLSEVTDPVLNHVRARLLETKSRAMAKKVLTSIKGVLAEAQLTGKGPPTTGKVVRIVRSTRHKEELAIPSRAEVAALFTAADARCQHSHFQIGRGCRRFRAMLHVMVSTGIRPSELRGLRKVDVDLDDGVIHIRQRADGQNTIGSVKSAAGRRSIDIPATAVAVLREWLVECDPGDLLFPAFADDEDAAGGPQTLANIYARQWVPLLRDAEVVNPDGSARYNIYALRHFHASRLIAAGASPKEVMTEMGHSSIQVTYDTYGHLFPEDRSIRRARAERMALDLNQGAHSTPARSKSAAKSGKAE